MRKFVVIIAVVVFAFSMLATAQEETPKAQVFGGFSLLHIEQGGLPNNAELNHYGWEAAVSYNANHWLGLKADFSGHYKDLFPATAGTAAVSFDSFTAVFGPELSYRGKSATPFMHALFGVNRLSVGSGPNNSDSAFAGAFGGGIDINLSDRFAFRLVQMDLLLTRHGGQDQKNLRASTGIVFRFGGH